MDDLREVVNRLRELVYEVRCMRGPVTFEADLREVVDELQLIKQELYAIKGELQRLPR